ncbi:MAG TPA: DNA polymerase IV [Opitutaceae bacterium]|jgi:DNA polymerase-4
MAPAAIVHLDADAFFVACEQARDPSLVGKKCAVGGRERGIISSASYEARACGVYTPMPTAQALRVCPGLVMIRHTPGLYGEVSQRMFDICESVTPLVQRNSIDEGYMDLGPCGHRSQGEVEAAVRSLQARILAQLKITVSMGIASNKMVAQIASKLRKPRGFVVVEPGGEAAFLEPLPLGRLPGIGAKTEAALVAKGLAVVGDLFRRSEGELAAAFGRDWRRMLAIGRGEDESPVETSHDEAKSYSKQETFGVDTGDFQSVTQVAKGMIDELMPLVRADGARVRTMTVRVRYPDLSYESCGQSIDTPTDLEGPFYGLAEPLLRGAWGRRRPVRLVSVRLSGVDSGPSQMEMFGEQDERRRRLAGAIDRLNRGGRESVVVHGHRLRPGENGNKKQDTGPRGRP